MKILVTGGAGMVGRNLRSLAKAKGFEIDSPTSKEVNLLSLDVLTDYVSKCKPDAIVHCAGLVGGIQANINSPFDFAYINSMLGLNVIKACLDNKIGTLLNLGTSCMYPRNAANPLTESQILQGELEPTNEGYAIAKVLSSRLCDYAHAQFDVNFKSIIPCNLYGLWDKFEPQNSHMIPAVIRKIHEAKVNGASEVEIWGDGSVRREFMFVEDLADFILFALENFNNLDQVTNVGLGFDYSIKEYYQLIAEVIGYKGEFTFDISKPAGMKQKLVDVKKTKQLNWIAKTNLKDGIAKTYKFYLREYA